MPSEKLKYVIQEIKDILIKHDVAGVVAINEGEHTEYLNHLDPSWSDIFYDLETVPGEVGVRFRSRKADFPNELRALQQERIEQTVNMIVNLRHVTGIQYLHLEGVNDMIESGIEIIPESKGEYYDHEGKRIYAKPRKEKTAKPAPVKKPPLVQKRPPSGPAAGPDLSKLGL